MQIEVNREQLELLKFMVLHYEYDDDKEREVVEQLEFKLYEAEDKDSLRLKNMLLTVAKILWIGHQSGQIQIWVMK